MLTHKLWLHKCCFNIGSSVILHAYVLDGAVCIPQTQILELVSSAQLFAKQ